MDENRKNTMSDDAAFTPADYAQEFQGDYDADQEITAEMIESGELPADVIAEMFDGQGTCNCTDEELCEGDVRCIDPAKCLCMPDTLDDSAPEGGDCCALEEGEGE
jgi:hypothetical protein